MWQARRSLLLSSTVEQDVTVSINAAMCETQPTWWPGLRSKSWSKGQFEPTIFHEQLWGLGQHSMIDAGWE